MRIIICNKYFFETGGPEHYMFGLTDMLEAAGHEVSHFSVSATRNQPSPYARYFASPPVSPEAYDARLAQKPVGLGAKLRMARRTVYFKEAYTKLRALIRDTKPDIVYVLNFSNYLSPSIIDAAADEGVPVVLQLKDFDMICASNVFLRDGAVCTECLGGKKYHGIVHRCVNGSLAASVARVGAMYSHDRSGVYDRVSAFATPSHFLQRKYIEDGYPAERMHHIPLFVDMSRFQPLPAGEAAQDYMLYIGRISPEKGVSVLIEAYGLLGPSAPPLLLMGWPEAAEEAKLKARCAQLQLSKVQFIGPKSGDELVEIVRRARASVMPSICFDNTPHAIYESLACARPVIANTIGSLPEQVLHEQNGLLYETNSPQDLARQITRLQRDAALADRLGRYGAEHVRQEYSGEAHLQRTLDLFEQVLADAGRITLPMPAVSPGHTE